MFTCRKVLWYNQDWKNSNTQRSKSTLKFILKTNFQSEQNQSTEVLWTALLISFEKWTTDFSTWDCLQVQHFLYTNTVPSVCPVFHFVSALYNYQKNTMKNIILKTRIPRSLIEVYASPSKCCYYILQF